MATIVKDGNPQPYHGIMKPKESPINTPQNAEQLTNERGQTHGRFSDHSRYTMAMKDIIATAEVERQERKQKPLTDQHLEALHMIVHKIGRILAGDATVQDHWDDIGGYAHIANKDFGD